MRLGRLSLPGAAPRAELAREIRPDAGSAAALDLFPGQFDAGPADRRAWWAARAFAVLSVILGGTTISLCLALITLMPLKEKELVLVQLHPQNQQVVEMQPLRIGAPGIEIATRGWVAEWVQRRHDVVPDNEFMKAAVEWVARRAEPAVMRAYESESKSFVDGAIKQGIRRRSVVDAATVAQQAPGLWVVRFETVDTDRSGAELQRVSWSGTLRIEFRAGSATRAEVDKSAALANPFGFTVVEYSRLRS